MTTPSDRDREVARLTVEILFGAKHVTAHNFPRHQEEIARALAAAREEERERMAVIMREADEVLRGHMVGVNCHGPTFSDDLARRWQDAIRDRGEARDEA